MGQVLGLLDRKNNLTRIVCIKDESLTFLIEKPIMRCKCSINYRDIVLVCIYFDISN